MRFYIPDIDPALAEDTWTAVRRHLADLGMPTNDRRLESIAFHHDGDVAEAKVGGHFPGTRDHVLLILEGSEAGVHYVCTPTHGVVAGRPYRVEQADARAVPFDR